MATGLRARLEGALGRDFSLPDNWWVVAFRRVLRDRRGRVGLILVLFLVSVGVLAPVVAPFDPFETHVKDQFHPPSRTYLFGTDELGRDILSRVIHGTRISLTVGVLSVGSAMALGTMLGFFAGYFGGAVDSVIMRFQDCILAFPGILLAVTIVAILGSSFFNVLLAVAIVNIPRFARIARGSMLGEKERDYVMAAVVGGANDRYIMFRSILPNSLAPSIVQMTIAMATAILLEAGLSFLGVGNPPPIPSWGAMLNTAKRFMYRAPWYGIFPGLAITILLLGFYILDDSLQQALMTKKQRFR